MEFFCPFGEKNKRICFNSMLNIELALSQIPSELGDRKAKIKANKPYLTKWCLKKFYVLFYLILILNVALLLSSHRQNTKRSKSNLTRDHLIGDEFRSSDS